MSSTPQTAGFQLSVLPQFQGPDPRLFNFGGALAEGLSSGVNTGGRLQDIQLAREAADYAQSQRPMKEQLMDIQLQSAGAGLESQRAAQHLADIALPGQEIKAKQPIILEENTFMDLDENGNLAEYKRQKKQDPTTGEISYAPRIYSKTIKTKAQLESDKALKEAQAESLKALATSRTNKDPKFESELIQRKLEAAIKDGDEEEVDFWTARQARLNALPGMLAPGTTFDRGTEKMGLGAGFTKEQIAVLGKTQAGINAMRKLDTANTLMKAEKEFNLPELKLTPEEQTAISGVKNIVNAPAANTKPVANFRSVQEAQAAAARGAIKPGDRIVVAGQPGTWQ